ncbi:MAG: hypothetical protein AAGF14_03135, partial [Pseudomonadota bacterium]
MTGYAATPSAGLPTTPSSSGSSGKLPKFAKGLFRTVETFFLACQAASEYQRRLATAKHENAGDVARDVYTKYFDG